MTKRFKKYPSRKGVTSQFKRGPYKSRKNKTNPEEDPFSNYGSGIKGYRGVNDDLVDNT